MLSIVEIYFKKHFQIMRKNFLSLFPHMENLTKTNGMNC